MNCVWTEAEKNFVRENASRLRDHELATSLTRLTGRRVTPQAVQHFRYRLGIKKARGRGVCRVLKSMPPR